MNTPNSSERADQRRAGISDRTRRVAPSAASEPRIGGRREPRPPRPDPPRSVRHEVAADHAFDQVVHLLELDVGLRRARCRRR